MSVRTYYDTFCDFPDCLSWAENCTSSESRNDARNKAENAGWTYVRWYGEYYDMCPYHKSKNPRDVDEEINA